MHKPLATVAGLIILAFCSSPVSAGNAAKTSPAVAASDWSGFYIGGRVGYGWTNDPTQTIFDLSHVFVTESIHGSGRGADGGLHVGYNWQFAPTWLFGIEYEWSWTNLKVGGTVSPVPSLGGAVVPGTTSIAQTTIHSVASLRGRMGYATPAWMGYLAVGPAWADAQSRGDEICPTGDGCGPGTHAPIGPFTSTLWGWGAGGGVEFRTKSPWIVGVEYAHYRFGAPNPGRSLYFSLTTGSPVSPGLCIVASQCGATFSSSGIDVDVVRIRFSYKGG